MNPSPHDPSNLEADASPPLRDIGTYRLVKHLGNGGMGHVYLARHREMNRMCALKLLPPELASQGSFSERFRSEAQILARLDHPAIVRIYNFGEATGEFFLEMEFVDDGDLEHQIRRRKKVGEPYTEEEVTRLIDAVLQAVGYAHERRIVHRDLKPGNILVSQDGAVKVSDFGLATVVGDDFHRSLIEKSITLSQVVEAETMVAGEKSSAPEVAGTVLYMSPQALAGEKIAPADDLYSLGVITYYLLTGNTPTLQYKPPSQVRKGLSRGWDNFVGTLLNEKREDRYPSAEEARKALQKLTQRSKTLLWVALGAGGFLATAAGVAALLLSSPEAPTPEKPPLSENTPEPVTALEPGPPPVAGQLEAELVAETEPPPSPTPEPIIAEALAAAPLPEVVVNPPESIEPPPPPGEISLPLPGGLAMSFRRIEAGAFRMGSPQREMGRRADELLRRITIAEPFYIGATEVTQEQYAAVMGQHPSRHRFGGRDRPVEQVLFRDLVRPFGFLERLNDTLLDQDFPWRVALPTEEQWEYAARAGTTTALPNGTNLRASTFDLSLDQIGNHNSVRTEPVASREPNAWGLYDVVGNVWEWTANGVLRGGSYADAATLSRSASRLRGQQTSSQRDSRFGFRLVLLPAE